MDIKTNLLEDYGNFVDSPKKQITYSKFFVILFVVIISLFLFLVLFKYINE